jgi:hypothetical protein
MELSNYELVRYPSGQHTITRITVDAHGVPTSGPRDVVGTFATEAEAQAALARLIAGASQTAAARPSRAA